MAQKFFNVTSATKPSKEAQLFQHIYLYILILGKILREDKKTTYGRLYQISILDLKSEFEPEI